MLDFIDDVNRCNASWHVARLPPEAACDIAALAKSGKALSEFEWLSANIPAQIHDVLLAHGNIRHPFEIGAARECTWISESDWLYRLEFPHGSDVNTTHYFLHFEGLDTIVDVYLNGEHIAEHRDQFLPLRIDVTEKLREKNHLLLHFFAPLKWLENQPEFRGFLQSGGQPRKALRKGPEDFSFFNEANPYFAPIGIYAPISLESADSAEIHHLDIETKVSKDLTAADISLKANILIHEPVDTCMHVKVYDPCGQLIHEDSFTDTTHIHLFEPALWYPHTLGEQPLYRLEVALLSEGRAIDHLVRDLGVCRVERRAPFDFLVNGKQVKLWGANLAPLPRPGHIHDEAMLNRLLDFAVQAHMPVMRVWGPGQPWPEHLYAEADKRGILLWVEFPYTGSGFPEVESYVERCRQEAEHTVREFKHHVSVLFWSGGNEAFLGLETPEPPEDDSDRKLFKHVLQKTVEAIDPSRWYIPNSPHGGSYGNDPCEGDSHIRDYMFFQTGDRYPVLASENTRLTIPLAKTLRRYLGENLKWPADGFTGARSHFNQDVLPESFQVLTPSAFWSNIRPGAVGSLFEADGSPESFLFRIGAGSAVYIRETVERIRRGRPHHQAAKPRRCKGYMWWKFNDTFPMIYSSLIDDQLEPNMAYYALRRAYTPVLLSVEIDDGAYFWVVNDGPELLEGCLEVHLIDHVGTKTIASHSFPVQIPQGEALPVGDSSVFGIMMIANPLLLILRDREGKERASTLVWLCPEREIYYPEETGLHLRQDGQDIVIGCDQTARWIELSGTSPEGDPFGWTFEDNYFDALPHRDKRIRVSGNHDSGTITAHSRYADDSVSIQFASKQEHT